MPHHLPREAEPGTAPGHACPAEDRQVGALVAAERFLVWCLRQWVEGWRNGVADSQRLRDGFAAAYAPDGMAPFDAMMRAVVAGTRRQLDVRCLHCRFVSADENLFLNIVAAGQRDRDDLMTGAFDEFVAPTAVRIATSAALSLGNAMTAAGLLLPLTTVPGIARGAAMRATGRGLRLVQ